MSTDPNPSANLSPGCRPSDAGHATRSESSPSRSRRARNAGRHLLTASHVVGWTASDAGWLLFQPDYYDGDVFPSSYAEVAYYYEKISDPQGE